MKDHIIVKYEEISGEEGISGGVRETPESMDLDHKIMFKSINKLINQLF